MTSSRKAIALSLQVCAMAQPTENLQKFQDANAQYVERFKAEGKGNEALPPARKVAILACMDARLHPTSALGLEIGDSHIIRNAGGRATADALRSLTISQRLLGTTEVHVIHHTDCGMLTFNNHQLRDIIKKDLDHEVPADTEFYPFTDLAQSVRDDVATIQQSPLVAKDTPVFGHVYDVKTGKLERIA